MHQNGRLTEVGARFAFGLRGLLVALVVAGGTVHAAESLDAIRDLARQGAPQLAERLLRRDQPSRLDSPAEWFGWERERIALLRLQGRHDAVERRLEQILGEPVPHSVAVWALQELVTAQLLDSRDAAALGTLRKLLWNGAPPTGDAPVDVWQRQIATAYLRLGRGEDADRALARYVARPDEDMTALALLRARVSIQIGRHEAVAGALADISGDEAELLRWLAVLRMEPGRAREVLKAASELAARIRLSDGQRQQAWALMAEAAAAAGHRPGQMTALERLFDAERLHTDLGGVFTPALSQLREAYLAYGAEVASTWQLSEDEAQWLGIAKTAQTESPFAARGLYGVLIEKSGDSATREAAAMGMLDLLVNEDMGGMLALRLFSQPDLFAINAALPNDLRHRLIDLAIAHDDVRRAADWSVDLDEPLSRSVDFDRRLRQARVLLLDGRDSQAIALLLASVVDPAMADAATRDRFVQVVFDLQAAGRHAPAVELFETLLRDTEDVQQRRELWYWIGDSRKALGDPVAAARAYLASAGEPDPYSMDPWAQTARYQAAEQLSEAGLTLDAGAIYARLLSVTRDAARQALLRSRIHQLGIKARARANGE